MAITGNLKLIIVDHIGIVVGTSDRQSEYERICEITRSLKCLAKVCGCCVLALCQLNRDSQKGSHDTNGNYKGPNEPRLSDLRGSGSIEADSNAVVMLWNRGSIEEEIQHKTVCIKKNRTGKCLNIDTTFHAASGQCFSEGWVEEDTIDSSEPFYLKSEQEKTNA